MMKAIIFLVLSCSAFAADGVMLKVCPPHPDDLPVVLKVCPPHKDDLPVVRVNSSTKIEPQVQTKKSNKVGVNIYVKVCVYRW